MQAIIVLYSVNHSSIVCMLYQVVAFHRTNFVSAMPDSKLETHSPSALRVATCVIQECLVCQRLPSVAISRQLWVLVAQAIGTDQAKRRRTMVFCNTMDSCRATEFYLKDNGIATACYHGDVPADGRRDAIQQFCDPDDGVPPVMVCSDLAAR